MEHVKLTYILSANQEAMELYRQSKETLINSNSYDFMVFRFSEWDGILEDLEEWEDYVAIDEATYHALHSNLCVKFRGLIKYL